MVGVTTQRSHKRRNESMSMCQVPRRALFLTINLFNFHKHSVRRVPLELHVTARKN